MFLVTKILANVTQMMIGNFFGNFGKSHTYIKTAAATVWATFGNIFFTFYSNIWSHWTRQTLTKYHSITAGIDPIKNLSVSLRFARF